MPKISIVMPIYINVSDKIVWLNEAIQSVINQSFQDWELLAVNDASPFPPDETKWIFREDKRIRWFDCVENNGPALCRNLAVELAESDCILPLDADDKLANQDTLEQMYEMWLVDKSRIIYGNLQRLIPSADGFVEEKIFSLPQYSFDAVMRLDGIMPVTGMHSKDCHFASGGWKQELGDGLEDVEYWLAAGKAGYCGLKIQHTTLLYRRQEDSRAYKMKDVNFSYGAMQEKIKEMHSDIYRGEFPMACCGGKGNTSVANDEQQVAQIRKVTNRITKLENFSSKDLVWIEYQGSRKGSFDIHMKNPPAHYRILGTGHKLQAHINHVDNQSPSVLTFRRMNRGRDFLIAIPDPTLQPNLEPEIEVAQKQHSDYVAPKPQLPAITRLDPVAVKSRGIELPEMPPQMPPSYLIDQVSKLDDETVRKLENIAAKISKGIDLSQLNLKNVEAAFIAENWTVEKIASAKPEDLTHIKGVGLKRATKIIERAKQLIDQT